MDKQLNFLEQKLREENLTCVVQKEQACFASQERGIKPILLFLRQDPDCLRGASAADKVIGKAAALLFVYGGIRQVYAGVISTPALEVFQQYGVVCEYGTLVDRIQNRKGDGLCPMETRAMTLTLPEEAYEVFHTLIFKEES